MRFDPTVVMTNFLSVCASTIKDFRLILPKGRSLRKGQETDSSRKPTRGNLELRRRCMVTSLKMRDFGMMPLTMSFF